MRPVRVTTEVLILMHPDEARHAKNTGRLLHLCLPGSRLLSGTRFDDHVLNDALFCAWGDQPPPEHTLLLYPGTGGVSMPKTATGARVRLVLIDATWRKSRQLVAAHAQLQRLPRLALNDPPPSRYAIRKAHEAHQLSTLEAAQLALTLLEPASGSGLKGLNDAMAAFVAIQRPFWPHAT
ncbi:tRNA-uridine aminocarboxypropyltransferase [Diaphorobacter aerolatus]|uniref:tRNA-uridine aminocarboxypropyltransferase n=1 Tax=Diaphorobacter aerolatus TaxID=1288495 RepID=UPI0021F7F1CE|nr:tRNA-uridine aminocarboxypropyltransferase [Diaphorobacter aerolatus]